MDKQQRGILTLVRSAITGEVLPLPRDFDPAQAYPVVVKHQLVPLVYEGALRCGLSRTLPTMQTLFQGYCRCLAHSERQLQMIRRLYETFDANAIDYMPLKGCNMKALYPKPELRLMGDADILIRREQYEAIRPLVERLGMTEKVEGEYDFVWESPALKLELHKKLVGESNRDLYGFLGDGWSLAKPVAGSRYAMGDEDQFLYLFAHFTKHYRDGGIGIRHVVDLWVYLRTHPEMDPAYLTKSLERMHLAEFYENIRQVMACWFEDAAETDKTAFISEYVFQSGSWGTHDAHRIAANVKDVRHGGGVRRGKLRRLWMALFPELRIMQNRYPVLRKAPVLLPVFWPYRWIEAVLFRRDRVRRQRENMKGIDTQEIRSYEQALQYVGLDFHVKE